MSPHPYESTRAKVKTHNTQGQYINGYKYLTHICLRCQYSNWTECSLSFLIFKTRRYFCKAWGRTSRELQQWKQSWSQGKVRRSRQSQRWSPAKSSSAISQILNRNAFGIQYVSYEIPTEHCWVSKEDIHDSNIFLIGIVKHLTLLKELRI